MIGILSIKYQTQTRGAVDLDVLKACIGERVKVIIELYFEDTYICSDENDRVVWIGPDKGKSGRSYNNDLIYFSDPTFLAAAQVGDLFFYANTETPSVNFSFTLLEKINDNLGRFDKDFPAYIESIYPPFEGIPHYEFDTRISFSNISALKALVYQFGINDANSFVSKVDGSVQKFTLSSSTPLTDVVSQALLANGKLDWQTGTVTLVGLGDDPNFPDDTHVRIRLTQELIVTPLFLEGQYENLRLGIAPDYFTPDNVIKFQAQIDWNKSNAFLDGAKQVNIEASGQFGWFGTRFDGVQSDYSISSLTIQRVSDSEFIDKLEYNEVEVKFKVNSADGNLSAANTRAIFGFNYLPSDDALYVNTNRSQETNFCFDSKKITPNGVPVNGDYFGTDAQVIKNISADVISPTEMEVTVRILFGNDRVDILTQGDIANYAMWVIVENIDFDVELCDKSSLLIQVDEIYVQLTKVDLLTDITNFIQHPYNLVAGGESTLEMFPVDDVAVNSLFGLDYTGLESDGILLKSCTPQLVLTHATEADIVLDSFKINLENYPTIGSNPAVQAIDFNQLRPYKVENGIRKYVALERDFNQDTASIKYFVLNFPFMNRWEYWFRIARVTSIPETLFDASVPFNGANHLWNRLANSAGWSLVYRVNFNIIQNGKLFEQEFNHTITSAYFNTNTDWNNCNIKTYDLTTDDEIVVGPKKYAYGAKDTKVVCSFEKTVGAVPDVENVAMVLWAEGFEGGGITEITRISSVYEVTDVSCLKSIDTSNKLKVTKTGSVFTGEALLDFSKIQNLSKMTLYARIYEIVEIPEEARVTNDFILRITNDLQVRLVL